MTGVQTCALPIYAAFVAGHSVGEISAAAIAGVISDIDAMKLVRARGREMAKAAALTEGGMAAVLKNPLLLASIGVRPVARSIALSKPIQNNLIQGAKKEISPEAANLAKLLMIRASQGAGNE